MYYLVHLGSLLTCASNCIQMFSPIEVVGFPGLSYNVSMYVKVIVTPGAKKEKIEKQKDNHFTIAVKEKAERNMANTRVLEVLSAFLAVPKNHLKIVTGHQSRSKIISVSD